MIVNMTLIQNSLEWNKIETDLIHKSTFLKHGQEIRKMIYNIGREITELSKHEVQARRGKKGHAERLLIKINEDIETVEGFLLVAALIG
jgi:predicted translin family RNA/ssDNA-binding protein